MIKALSAMRLTKEDSQPNAILARRIDPSADEVPFIPALPTAPGSSVPEEINEGLDRDKIGEPCLF